MANEHPANIQRVLRAKRLNVIRAILHSLWNLKVAKSIEEYWSSKQPNSINVRRLKGHSGWCPTEGMKHQLWSFWNVLQSALHSLPENTLDKIDRRLSDLSLVFLGKHFEEKFEHLNRAPEQESKQETEQKFEQQFF